MECKVDDSLIQGYLEGELDRLEEIIIGEHIKSCKKCRKELTEMKLLLFELDGLREVKIPDEIIKIREGVINELSNPSAYTGINFREMLKTQKAVLKSSSIYLEFVPGAGLVEKGIKKVPSLLFKAASAAIMGGRRLVMARARA